MSDGTKIEWADATVNAINGCSLASPGCTNCYAMRLAGTRLRDHPSRAGLTQQTKAGPVWTGEVRLSETALLQPLRWKRPRRIFWNAHGDTFHDAVPDEWLDRLFAVCALTPQHTHMILTKRSARMREYVNKLVIGQRWMTDAAEYLGIDPDRLAEAVWPGVTAVLPSNIWLGVSVEDQTRADERIPDLLATPAAIRFISAEPLLGPVDLTRIEFGAEWLDALAGYSSLKESETDLNDIGNDGLDWVIVGGESGPRARPMHADWARSLRDQCAAADVAFHFKQWGACLPGNMDGEDERGRVVYEIEDVAQPVDYAELGRGKLVQAHGCDFIRFHRKTGRMLDGVEHNGVPT